MSESISKQIKYQILRVAIPTAGAIVNINANTDKLYKKITGILVTVPYLVTFLNRSTLNLLINDKEIFPDDFEVKLITCDSYVPTNERFYLMDDVADGSTVKGKFKDGADAGAVYPYTVNIYLKLEERV